MMTINYNDQQQSAIQSIKGWWDALPRNGHTESHYFLAGYAGTGKTTVARAAACQCVGEHNMHMVEFIAPTGKAASRLRQKGNANARTLHQFAYRLRGEDDEGNPVFGAKGILDYRPKLVVLDEASMVGEKDYEALTRHGIPILALGDIGQLPPVKQASVFKAGNENFLLDKIERQGGDSNIIRASMFVRRGQQLPFREYEDVKVRPGVGKLGAPLEELVAHALEDTQILCSYHSTRTGVNLAVRAHFGYRDKLPEVGEKVVCKFNQHGFGIMNGEQGIVLGYKTVDTSYDDGDGIVQDDDDDGTRIILKSLTDGITRTVRFERRAFSDDIDERKEYMKKPGAFDFGYALTVHSAQGSEWPNVLVLEEHMRGVPYNQLMYTAVTRAQNVLTIYRV